MGNRIQNSSGMQIPSYDPNAWAQQHVPASDHPTSAAPPAPLMLHSPGAPATFPAPGYPSSGYSDYARYSENQAWFANVPPYANSAPGNYQYPHGSGGQLSGATPLTLLSHSHMRASSGLHITLQLLLRLYGCIWLISCATMFSHLSFSSLLIESIAVTNSNSRLSAHLLHYNVIKSIALQPCGILFH